ncbi:MAG TPA: type IV secretory system conjugative DNA transfer family protein [Chloroflexota bacterium]
MLVNTARGTVGEDTAAPVGATILNLVALTVSEQAALDARQRRPVTLFVDEFHTMPGADYEGILAELAKYGANLVLATQSLAQLGALDREQHRALRATVFANLDGLFAFHTSAEDAQYLVRELGPEIDEQDLVGLGEHRCYVRLSAGGERLPVFSLHLDPPPTTDAALADRLATASAALHGRDADAVERDIQSAVARIELTHHAPPAPSPAGHGGGVERGAAGTLLGTASRPPARKPARNEYRDRKSQRAEVHQATFLELADGEANASGGRASGQAEATPTPEIEELPT